MALPLGDVINDDEVFYHGSDDEDYSDPQARQLRYRHAGKRYLDGDVPFLLSASLRGPFERTSGWDNPWKSGQRCEPRIVFSTTLDSSRKQLRNDFACRSGEVSTSESLHCHLPSPESLRQASVSEPCHFLQGQGLDMVQRWRQDIQPPSLTQDSFWTSTNEQKHSSAKKRRAIESAWLKRRTNKKRKPDLAGRQKPKTTTLSSRDGRHSSPDSESCSSAFEASSPCGPRLIDSNVLMEQDGLDTCNTNTAFDGTSAQLTASKKPTSPSQCVLSSVDSHISGVLHEPRQAEEKVATPSSPSSRQSKMPAYTLELNQHKNRSPAPSSVEASLNTEEQSDGETRASDGDGWLQDACSATSKKRYRRLQTQHDRSFSFKIRSAAENTPENRRFESFAKTANQCRPSAIELPIDELSFEKKLKQPLSDDDSARTDEDGRKEDKQQGRLKVLNPEISDLTFVPLNEDEFVEEGNEAMESSSVMIVEDNSLFAAPPGSNLARDDLTTRLEYRDNEETAITNTPLPATSTQYSVAANQHEDQGSQLTAGLEESPESGSCLSSPRSALLPNHQGKTSTRPSQTSQTDETPQGYSIRLLLNQLVPPSPWAKLSQLARSSVSTGILRNQTARASTPVSCEEGAQQLDEAAEGADQEGAEVEGAIVESGFTASYSGPSSPKEDRLSDNSDPEKDLDMGETKAVDDSTQALIPASQQSPWVRLAPLTDIKIVPSNQVKGDVDTDMSECEEVESQRNYLELTASHQSPWTAIPPSTNVGQHRAVDGCDLNKDLEMNDTQDNEPQDLKTAASQQSPWTETHFRDQPSDGEDQISQAHHVGTEKASMYTLGLASSSSSAVVTGSQPRIQRPHTPEPEFAIKPFASFVTPSPERPARALRSRAGTMGGLASALKNPWSGRSSRPDRRVSWASPPSQEHSQNRGERAPISSSITTSAALTPLPPPPASRIKTRQVSPPPPLLNSSLSPGTKFSRHFAIAASRRRRLPSFVSSPVLSCSTSKLRLIPTASQQGQTPGPRAMAEAFLAADDAFTPEQPQEQQEQDALLDRNGDVGVVDDILRDVGDFFFALDADIKLDDVRGDPRAEASQCHATAFQSRW
ncbi:hypothetical protein CP533_2564 [Ophiocordyceps camponoti-saundersi (nom. inval.)]|nr:hypothetical protein CP533_2564 [Ophiocordyceps camponoti-saundersi (nom. inval.)]